MPTRACKNGPAPEWTEKEKREPYHTISILPPQCCRAPSMKHDGNGSSMEGQESHFPSELLTRLYVCVCMAVRNRDRAEWWDADFAYSKVNTIPCNFCLSKQISPSTKITSRKLTPRPSLGNMHNWSTNRKTGF